MNFPITARPQTINVLIIKDMHNHRCDGSLILPKNVVEIFMKLRLAELYYSKGFFSNLRHTSYKCVSLTSSTNKYNTTNGKSTPLAMGEHYAAEVIMYLYQCQLAPSLTPHNFK